MVQGVVSALMEACRVLQKDRATAIAFAKSTNQLPNDAVDDAYDRLTKASTPFFGVDGGMHQDAFDATVKLMIDSGDLSGPVSWEQAADTTFVTKGNQELGPYS